MSELADKQSEAYARAFDAIDWHLVLYENGKVGYDDTIRAIINYFALREFPCRIPQFPKVT